MSTAALCASLAIWEMTSSQPCSCYFEISCKKSTVYISIVPSSQRSLYFQANLTKVIFIRLYRPWREWTRKEANPWTLNIVLSNLSASGPRQIAIFIPKKFSIFWQTNYQAIYIPNFEQDEARLRSFSEISVHFLAEKIYPNPCQSSQRAACVPNFLLYINNSRRVIMRELLRVIRPIGIATSAVTHNW